MVKAIAKAGAVVTLLLTNTLATADTVLTDKASIEIVISQLTMEEKSKLVVGTGMNNSPLVPGAAGSTLSIPRLGIPQMVVADGPIGVRLGAGPTGGSPRYATAFPISSALSASWNESLIHRVAAAMGDEAKAFGVDLLLGPALNIQRDPLNGRNFEYFSEDPLLSGRITAAFVNGIQSMGVGATLKHFAANNQETNRQSIDQLISERALREIYLAGFEYAIKNSQPWAVMSSYPAINGIPASQNSRLLTDILRTEWGFNGLVMSDWYGVKDPVHALPAGNDLIMPGGLRKSASPFQAVARAPEEVTYEALRSGQLTDEMLNANIRSILGVVLKSAVFNGNQPEGRPDLAAHAAIARASAVEGMVLLKNTQWTLPVGLDRKIAVFGRNAQNFYLGGGGSAEVNADPGRIVTLLDGLSLSGYRLVNNTDEQQLHEGMDPKQIINAANQSDIALISIGRSSSEGADRYSMAMHADELALIKNVSEVFHRQGKKVIVLLNIGAPIEMMDWDADVDAILLTWQPGQEGGNAVADILSGKISPSGKLPLTIPKYYRDVPSYGNFPGQGGTVNYGEGIYVGYRHYDTRHIQPMYPFGHGLSYVDFGYSHLQLSSDSFNLDAEQNITLSVQLKNNGSMLAKEVVQLYIHDPASRIDRPMQELKGFQKVELLPNESRTISFVIDKRALSFYDVEQGGWRVEPGYFVARLGSSSRDIRGEVRFKAINPKAPAISMETPWIEVQTYQQAATIVARYIGDDETNAWIRGTPTLGDKIQSYIDSQPELKADRAKQFELLHALLSELNEL